MAVIVEDYRVNGYWAFTSRCEAEEWLRENRGVITFLPSGGVTECWDAVGDRPVANILPTEEPE